jgi:ribonuclease VapC
MTRVVLDASALLAKLLGEPGADSVGAALGSASISAINYAEVLTSLIELGVPPREARDTLDRFDCEVIEADKHRAILAGELHAVTRRTGVSLGDRFCLALGRELGVPVLTTDRRWKTLDLDVEVTLIR